MGKVISAFDRVLVDLTRTVDQLERAIDNDITLQVGGAVIDNTVTSAILRNTPLAKSIVAGLAGAGFAYAMVALEMLPVVAVEAIQEGRAAEPYLNVFKSLSDRLKIAVENVKTQASVNDLKSAVDQSPIFYADSLGAGPSLDDAEEIEGDHEFVKSVLAGLGLTDVSDFEEIEPGVFTGTAILNGDAPVGPFSVYPQA